MWNILIFERRGDGVSVVDVVALCGSWAAHRGRRLPRRCATVLPLAFVAASQLIRGGAARVALSGRPRAALLQR